MKLVANNSSKIGRNELCPCGSGVKYKKCCWESDQAKGMSAEEANNYFTGMHMDDIAAEARELTQTPQKQAEDLAFQAHSAKTPKQQILMAQKALELDSNCAEAYLVLDSVLAQDPIESIEYMEKASAAARKTLGKKYFEENEGHFWGLYETRSYMRAQQYLAQSLWDCRRQSEAIQICWDLLRLNPNDNQGVRYILFDYLLTDNRLEEIEKLVKKYTNDDFAHWEYNKALYYFKLFGSKSEKVIKQIQKAYQQNSFIEKYLTAKSKIPDEFPDSYSPGSKEEAICYLQDSLMPWMNTPQAVEWLDSLKLSGSKTRKAKAKSKAPKGH